MAESERVELAAGFPHRGAMRGPGGGVAADHPLAAGVGLSTLRQGGSAADAAVAMAAVMTVVQPQYSHLGGDAFALAYRAADGRVEALNSSGPAPAALEPSAYRDLGTIPGDGPLAVTVPGCVDGWWQLHQRYGKLPWAGLFDAAVELAADGFPASRGLARAIPLGRRRVYPADYFRRVFGGVGPGGGQRVVQPELARTLRAIRDGGASAFYEGDIAHACIAGLNGRGGVFTEADWRPPGRWETPLSVSFAGLRVHTQPPPSRGLILMLALKEYETALNRGSGDPHVTAYRAINAAFATVDSLAGDPDASGFDASSLLEAAPGPASTEPGLNRSEGDTTYLLAIDSDGNAVSFIQSVFQQWGSGAFVPETGILMNNRMRGFTLESGHPNEIAAGKRPMHTLHSYVVTVPGPELLPLAEKTGGAPHPEHLFAVGGTPGAHRQPQTNIQVLDHVIRERMDPQDALDAPRWARSETTPGVVDVERREQNFLGDAFRQAAIPTNDIEGWHGQMGRSYLAIVEPNGVAVAADLRGEGSALVL